jgi:hypothetical protein
VAEHELKTWPEPFAAVRRGEKTHEYRVNDRNYAVGDVLVLREWVPHDGTCYLEPCNCRKGRYTGEVERVRVTYVMKAGSFGLPIDVCVMSVKPLGGTACLEKLRRALCVAHENLCIRVGRDAADDAPTLLALGAVEKALDELGVPPAGADLSWLEDEGLPVVVTCRCGACPPRDASPRPAEDASPAPRGDEKGATA